MGLPVCPLVLSAMLDVAVKSHVLRMDDLRAAFPPADTRPVIAETVGQNSRAIVAVLN